MKWRLDTTAQPEGYGYEAGGEEGSHPVAVDFRTPATELELSEELSLEDRQHEQVRMFRWLIEQCVLRMDGELHTPAGIAIRMCCLASLLQLHPLDGVPFNQIARHCGVTRAAVSKTMLDLSVITGIRSRQQRSEDARSAYRKRAVSVHARDKGCVDSSPTGSSR